MQIIQPTKLGAYAALLFGDDAGDQAMSRFEKSMTNAVKRSFEADRQPMRHPTNDEVVRRGNILIDWVRKLLDSQWSVARVCDFVDQILNDELSDGEWTPPTISFWKPS